MEFSKNGSALDLRVIAAASGDREAFAELVGETANLVASISLAIVRDVELSRDIAQEVFLAAWRDLGKLRQPSSFLPWLRQTTRNQAHQALRGRIRKRRLISDGEAEELLAAESDPRPTAGELLIAAEDQQRLAAAIESLPDATREVVTLYYREGRSARQVGELLGLREEAVKQRLSRARTSLRESLLEEVGRTLAATAPGAAFTGAVIAALASPATASAAGIAAASSSVAVGSPWLQLGSLVGGATLGAFGGIAGLCFGLRQLMAGALDERERRELRRFRAAGVAAVVVAAALFPLAWRLTGSPWSQAGVFAGFAATLALLQILWLPRIVGRRLEAERLKDPARWAAARRLQLRWSIFGWTLGLLGGAAGLVAGIWKATGN